FLGGSICPERGSVLSGISNRTLVKLLHWEAGGLVIYYKRLEKGVFQPPDGMEQGGKLPWSSLVLMVEGIKVLDSRQLPRYTKP
uniref:IS66 family insertion sequence element accessory protein TnpB n=1 Tax=Algoriphagus sp. TaxID=1872435 RepID=UPI002618CABA